MPELRFENFGETPVLLLDGEELVGADDAGLLSVPLWLKKCPATDSGIPGINSEVLPPSNTQDALAVVVRDYQPARRPAKGG